MAEREAASSGSKFKLRNYRRAGFLEELKQRDRGADAEGRLPGGLVVLGARFADLSSLACCGADKVGAGCDARRESCESLRDVGDEIVGMLNSDRHTDQGRRNPDFAAS